MLRGVALRPEGSGVILTGFTPEGPSRVLYSTSAMSQVSSEPSQ